MTNKEVKEESLLPSVKDIILKHLRIMYSNDILHSEYQKYDESVIESIPEYKMLSDAMKEYGGLVKKVTVLEMKNAIVNSDTYQVDDSFVIYVDVACNSMDIAENSPKLKIH